MPRNASSAERRRLVVGFVLSIAVHGVVLWLPLRPPPAESMRATPNAPDRAHRDHLRLLRLSPRAADTPRGSVPARTAERAEAVEATRRSEPADLLDDDEAGDPAAPEKAPPRLGPMPRDARLWTSDPLEWAPLDEWDAEERAIALGARALSDVESSEATTRGMATWVRRSGSGQWGAAPGRLHLGGMTLPYCGGADASECGLGMAPGRRLDYRAWRWRFNELQRQGRQVDIRARLEERAAAIRARRDAVRRRGGGSE